MGHLSRRAAVMVVTPILALGILAGGFGVASASPTGRAHGPDHVALTTGHAHGPDHVALTTGHAHGPDHKAGRAHGPDHVWP